MSDIDTSPSNILQKWEAAIHSKTNAENAITSSSVRIQPVDSLSSNVVPQCHVCAQGGYLIVLQLFSRRFSAALSAVSVNDCCLLCFV